jgi:hypothetical protein
VAHQTKPLRSLEEARSIWIADLETGFLWWKYQLGNRCRMDRPAGLVHSTTGYVYVTAHGKKELVHRLIWMFATGADPGIDNEIDHINGTRTDNMFSNLRLSSRAQNCHNSAGKKSRICSAKGVDRHMGGFRARIMHDDVLYTKRFPTEAEASAWRQKMELELYGDFASVHRQ